MSYTRDNKRYRYDFHDYLRDNGTEVTVSQQTAAATDIVHTVTAGKTLYLDSWTMSIKCSSGATGGQVGLLGVRDALDAFQFFLDRFESATIDINVANSGCFPTLLTITAGWDIYTYSSNANVEVYGFIHGWEI